MNKTPVRMVCVSCLRSVELLRSDDENSQLCPFCGGTIEADGFDGDPLIADAKSPLTGGAAPVLEHHATIEWESTWERGTLGRLGRFHFRDRLGDGGFGQVYLAYDPRLDRDVAVKVLKQAQPTARVMERFFREARAVARLDHPNIVTVHDAGYSEGRCWVAYQLVSGRPLSWYRDQRKLDAKAAARVIRELALAIDHAHTLGVVHRDLKPANILIDDRGRPRLIDFGLARMFDVESDLTRDGAVVGTPFYMSPEQAMGFSSQVDERSDVYSLGVILLELLTGRQVTEVSSERSTRGFAAALLKPGLKSEGNPVKPADRKIRGVRFGESAAKTTLFKICDKAMASQPIDRYSSAKELATALEKWLDRQRNAGARLSFSMACIVMGLAASVLLIVGLKAAMMPTRDSLASAQATTSPWENPAAAVASSPQQADKPSAHPLPARSPGRPAVQPAAVAAFVGNNETHKVHRLECASAVRISGVHRRPFETVAEAMDANFVRCGTCRPHDADASPSGPSAPQAAE